MEGKEPEPTTELETLLTATIDPEPRMLVLPSSKTSSLWIIHPPFLSHLLCPYQ